MPTYEYRREDGTTFEVLQRITDPPLQQCPETGQPVTRLISGGVGLIFKGSGFYLTDYARKNGGEGSKAQQSGKSEAPEKPSDGGAKPSESGSAKNSGGSTAEAA